MRTLLISLFLLIIVAGFIIFYPGTVPYSLEVPGRVLPARQWIVSTESQGLISSTLFNHENGTSEASFVTEFVRGDAVRFNLRKDIKPGTPVAKNDTIGTLDSSEIERELIDLRNELNNKRAMLSMSITGEKEAVVEEARRQVEHAQEAYREQQNIVERYRRASEQNIIPLQQYELAQSQLKLYELNIQIAEARLEAVSTGEKTEEINVIRTEIEGLEREIESLEKRLQNYTIISPISGVVYDQSHTETNPGSGVQPNYDTRILVNIGTSDEYVVIMPITLRTSPYITQGRQIRCTLQGVDHELEGVVVNVGNSIQIIQDEQIIVATARIEADGEKLYPGTIANCGIILEPVTLLEYIFRTVNTVFNR